MYLRVSDSVDEYSAATSHNDRLVILSQCVHTHNEPACVVGDMSPFCHGVLKIDLAEEFIKQVGILLKR